MGEERVRLEHGVHRPLVRREVVDPPPAQPDRPFARPDEAADQVERRRLAASGRAEETEELTVADLEVERAQRDVAAVPLRDLPELDPPPPHRGVGRLRGRCRRHRHGSGDRTNMRTSCLGCGTRARRTR